MSMNSISAKLAQSHSEPRRRKRRSKRMDETVLTYTSGTETYTRSETTTCLKIDGLSDSGLYRLRQEPQKPVDLSHLKQSYREYAATDRRLAPRFELTLSVVVFNLSSSFRTESLNVSLNGVLLKELLPSAFMNTPIEILFSFVDPHLGERRHLLFRGEAIGTQLRSARVMFRSGNKNATDVLHQLLTELKPKAA